ncbi:glycosyltransferase [Salinibacter ruber]|uniref:glycosyltransferase n=1 Tax=Salinibacter ruber TaxID=146919 RepID=UPI002166ED9A|nr:glycosyltransferase involved in cell wall biosynthesis [Salinibacter ruber]
MIDQPLYYNLWQYINSDAIIYRPTDIYSNMSQGDNIIPIEKQVIRQSDAIISTSNVVSDYISSISESKKDIYTVRNGVDYKFFRRRRQPPEEYKSISNNIAIYVGSMDDRIDLNSIEEAANNLPGVTFVMIGPTNRRINKIDAHNILALGERDYHDVPAYMQHADVGIIPMSDHEANASRSPMKLYEYLASGIPVVSRNNNSVTQANTSSVWTYKERGQLSSAIRACLKNDHDNRKAKKVAKKQSWSKKVTRIMAIINRYV